MRNEYFVVGLQIMHHATPVIIHGLLEDIPQDFYKYFKSIIKEVYRESGLVVTECYRCAENHEVVQVDEKTGPGQCIYSTHQGPDRLRRELAL